jgi:hypothetical protein
MACYLCLLVLNKPMDCNKRQYRLDDIVGKIESGEGLEHCEELFYLVHHHHMKEEEAEALIYRSVNRKKQLEKAKPAETKKDRPLKS